MDLRIAARTDTLGGMCMRIECDQCKKPGWVGCGAHVEQVLGDVKPEDRCKCNEMAGSR
jgi:hypothetical protein